MGTLFNIQRFCLHDGDGIRTCVFLKGCPLRCVWCHNPESLSKTPELSFDRRKCTSCGRCLAVCPARSMENGMLHIDRKACILCGRCAQVCLCDANEIIGREMTAPEVMREVLKDKMFFDTSGGGLTVTGVFRYVRRRAYGHRRRAVLSGCVHAGAPRTRNGERHFLCRRDVRDRRAGVLRKSRRPRHDLSV